MADSVQPHRWQPSRLPHPWDSPGKNTGVGCHFLLQCMKVKSLSRVRLFMTPWLQPTRLLCPWDLPGKSARVRCHCLLHLLPNSWEKRIFFDSSPLLQQDSFWRKMLKQNDFLYVLMQVGSFNKVCFLRYHQLYGSSSIRQYYLYHTSFPKRERRHYLKDKGNI